MSTLNVVSQFWKNNEDFIQHSYIAKHDGYSIASKLTEVLSEMFCAGPSYYYIVDFVTGNIEYCSPSVKDVIGLDPTTVTFDEVVNRVHPDDLYFIQVAEEFNLKKVAELGMSSCINTKLSYCFRELTVKGTYELFQLQAVSIDVDAKASTYRMLNIHTNVNHLTPVNNYTLTLLGINGYSFFLQFDLKKQLELAQSQPVYTRRELEIVKLIAQGMETRHIAAALFISPHTAKTHRKNIMQKAGAKNVAQLVNFCLKKGIF